MFSGHFLTIIKCLGERFFRKKITTPRNLAQKSRIEQIYENIVSTKFLKLPIARELLSFLFYFFDIKKLQ